MFPFVFPSPALRRLVLLTSLAGNVGVLPAQTSTDPGPSLRLEPFIVQGRDTDLTGTAVSAAQGIVGARELDARPFLRRGELLEVIPGVVITQHSGGGKANQYFLRGFNLDHGTDFSVTVDGLPVNMRSHAHGQGYADLNFLIPELVRQLDYSKGPFFAPVGDFSAAGAAGFTLFDALPSGFASLTAGENNYIRFVAGDALSAGADTTWAVEYTHDDGPWKLREDFSRGNALLRRRWTAGNREYRLTAMGYQAKWRSTDQIPLREVATGTLDRFDSIDPTDGGETARASLAFDATLRGAGTTRFNAYAIYYRLNLFSNFTYFLDDPVNGDQFNQRDRRFVLGGELTHVWTAGKTTTTAGLQVRDDLVGELGFYRTSGRSRISTVRSDKVNEASAGVFLQNETRWGEKLRTSAGLRADGYRFKVDSDNPLNSGSRTAAIASPKVALVLGPWGRTEFYANAGCGFHSNDARGTVIRVDPLSGDPADAVAPLVRSRGIEFGLRTSAVPGLTSSVSFWGLDLDSELVFVGDAGGTEASGASRRYGVEFANFYRPSTWLTLDADVSFTRARYRDAGTDDRIANSIGTVVTAGATLGAEHGWFGSLRLRYFGPQPLVEDNSIQAPSSSMLNARVGFRARSWEFACDVLNLLDRQDYDIAYFYTSRLAGEPAAGVDDIHFHPAEPLTVRVGVTRRF